MDLRYVIIGGDFDIAEKPEHNFTFNVGKFVWMKGKSIYEKK